MRYQTEPGNEEKTKKFAVGCVSLPHNEIKVQYAWVKNIYSSEIPLASPLRRRTQE